MNTATTTAAAGQPPRVAVTSATPPMRISAATAIAMVPRIRIP